MARILIAGFKHETNTFSNLKTDLNSYRSRSLLYDTEIKKKFLGTKTEPAAFIEFCEAEDWQAIMPIYGDASPGGLVTEDTFNHFSETLCTAARDRGPFDAVMLSLHGAMVCEHTDDGEGELLAKLRDVIGLNLPIAATLDLHANVTTRMASLTDILIAYRTYPHVDQFEIAMQAAKLIKKTLIGKIKPTNTVRRREMLEGVDNGRTTAPGPMTEVLQSADLLLSQPGVLATSVCAGFAKADTHDTGPAVIITGDGNNSLYGKMAENLMDEVWESRHRRTVETVPLEVAIKRASMASGIGGPMVLADFADNPGGGGYGDATTLLNGMIDADIKNAAFASIYDPLSAKICWENGLGAIVHLNLGGKIDPEYGAPISVRGKVKSLTNGQFTMKGPMARGVQINMGQTAVLEVGGIDIVIASERFQVHDIMFFQHARIDITTKRVIAVKSAQHFRAAFEPLASEIIVVDNGSGLTSGDYRALNYTKIRRPIFPLDMD